MPPVAAGGLPLPDPVADQLRGNDGNGAHMKKTIENPISNPV